MKNLNRTWIAIAGILIFSSCGRDGDPGHCYFSLDWEYYNEDYGVYFYEDNNPDVPAAADIQRNLYYDCYPGVYDYYYESEDYTFIYKYNGVYELVQNPGTPGRFFTDGLDGADTFLDLYLTVYELKSAPNKGMKEPSLSSAPVDPYGDGPVFTETQSRVVNEGAWTLKVTQKVEAWRKPAFSERE